MVKAECIEAKIVKSVKGTKTSLDVKAEGRGCFNSKTDKSHLMLNADGSILIHSATEIMISKDMVESISDYQGVSGTEYVIIKLRNY